MSSEKKRSPNRWRVLFFGVPCLLLLSLMNHWGEWQEAERLSTPPPETGVRVNAEAVSGHRQIGIEERPLTEAQRNIIRFATLQEWKFDSAHPSPCPENLKALDGMMGACIGFMYPLEAGAQIRNFCLLRATQTCCYGPRPQFNQYVFVEMPEPVKFERFAPMKVTGTFRIDPKPEEGYIYRMEGQEICSASEEGPELDGAQVAEKIKAPLFDFARLNEMRKQLRETSNPQDFFADQGKTVVLEGFVLDRQETPMPRVVVGQSWWDGKQGAIPTMFDSLLIYLKEARQLPSAWKQRDVFIGTLQIIQEPGRREKEGLATLTDAVRASVYFLDQRRAEAAKPFLPLWVELLLWGLFIFLVLRSRWRNSQNRMEKNP